MVQIHIWYHQSSMNDLWKEILISLYSWLSLEESLSSNQVLGVNLNGIVTMIILMQNGLQKLWSGKHSRILAILSWIFPGRRPSVPRRLAAALQIFLDHLAVTCDIENDREDDLWFAASGLLQVNEAKAKLSKAGNYPSSLVQFIYNCLDILIVFSVYVYGIIFLSDILMISKKNIMSCRDLFIFLTCRCSFLFFKK